ncbi:hypothetical protein [Acidicapsa ligni]|uniref:hypothetical protein n=1 Tax=Acidicapsa ligni TaxID=542300 RepID=UPI0021DF4192|nr:hypothetical protein [Acidicapsa ligni]
MSGNFESDGRRAFLSSVRNSARKAIASLPDSSQVEKLDKFSRRYIEGVSALIERGLKASDWEDEEIAHFAQEISWATLAAQLGNISVYLDNGNGDSGGGTCVSRCADEYQQCYDENSCEDHWYGCLCCVPCSLQYMGCIARCVGFSGGFGGGGVVIA